MSLKNKNCKPCDGEEKPLETVRAEKLLQDVKGWVLSEDQKSIYLSKEMKDFSSAVDFITRVRDIAESEDHHPDIHLTSYKNLKIELSTHAIGGLSENDFILAAKINDLF